MEWSELDKIIACEFMRIELIDVNRSWLNIWETCLLGKVNVFYL